MIVDAAVKREETVYVGARHHIVYLAYPESLKHPHTQGFVTDKDEFLDRADAAKHAFECGQIKEPSDIIISEELW